MSTITVVINTTGAAFGDANYGTEVARILHVVADDVARFEDAATAHDVGVRFPRDVNGNTVGRVTVVTA